MPESHAGKLLIATPAITDPNFARSVVLICTHDEDGAFGLVLNQPLSDVRVVDPLPEWSELATSPAVVFRGGPVEPTAAFALGRSSARPEPGGAKPVFERIALLNLEESPDALAGILSECRIFAGYSGWGAGQLDGEIEGGGWFVVPAEPGDVFCERPDELWKAVLSRQTGALKLYAYFPPDPRAN